MLLSRRWRRPATVSQQHLQKRRLSPTGRLNLGFITKGKLAAVLIIPSLLGFPTVQPTSTSRQGSNKIFWGRCTNQDFLAPLPGRKITSASGVSHSQSFYFVIVFCFLIFFVAFYQKSKKLAYFL